MTNSQLGSASTRQKRGSDSLSSSRAPKTHQAPPVLADTEEANTNADPILGHRTYSTQSSKIGCSSGYVDESPANSSVDTLAKQREVLDRRLEAAKDPWKTFQGGRYMVGKLIGNGSFGVAYNGVMSDKTELAIKFEPRSTNNPLLRDEYRTYKFLSGDPRFPKVYFFQQGRLHNHLAMQLLGPSLEELFEICGSFTLKTVVSLAMQMFSRIQHLHEKSLICRDIKPEDFLIGRGTDNNTIYLIDLGLAKQYRSPTTEQHIPYRQDKLPTGMARYMSINTHFGREQSRRDDLEALWYVLVYFLRGRLPWQGIQAATDKEKYEKIGRKKKAAVEELCKEFLGIGRYLRYVRDLGFEDTPDYDYLRGLLSDALKDEGEEDDDDDEYPWMRQTLSQA